MNQLHNKTLTPYAKKLRREMTKEERKLWYLFLKTLPCTVKRQKVIGNYIVDFCISSANLVIELDGSQHYEPDNKEYDRQRDDFLRSQGYTVLRFLNRDVNKNFDGVCAQINKYL